MSGAKGPNKMPKSTREKKDSMTNAASKECDIGEKMLMNSSSKESFKQEENSTISHLPSITWCHYTTLLKVAS